MDKWCPKANGFVPSDICDYCKEPCGFPNEKEDEKENEDG